MALRRARESGQAPLELERSHGRGRRKIICLDLPWISVVLTKMSCSPNPPNGDTQVSFQMYFLLCNKGKVVWGIHMPSQNLIQLLQLWRSHIFCIIKYCVVGEMCIYCCISFSFSLSPSPITLMQLVTTLRPNLHVHTM